MRSTVDDAELVVDFLNTRDAGNQPHLAPSLDDWGRWLAESDLPGVKAPADLDDLLALRVALRRSIGADGPAIHAPDTPGEPDIGGDVRWPVDAGPAMFPVQLRVGEGTPSLKGEGAVGALSAAVLRLVLRDEWTRIKICPAHDCRWAFYDQSRNRSRHWCDMSTCGNRAKARSHRQRRT